MSIQRMINYCVVILITINLLLNLLIRSLMCNPNQSNMNLPEKTIERLSQYRRVLIREIERGQAYVALSRVKSLDSLYIYDLDPDAFLTHVKVIEFYNWIWADLIPTEGKIKLVKSDEFKL